MAINYEEKSFMEQAPGGGGGIMWINNRGLHSWITAKLCVHAIEIVVYT